MGPVGWCTHGTMDTNNTQNESLVSEERVSSERLTIDLLLCLGVVTLCILLFVLYLFCAPAPEKVPREYYMKTRLPLLLKLEEVKKAAKKAKKAQQEVFLY